MSDADHSELLIQLVANQAATNAKLDSHFGSVTQRFDDVNQRFDDVNKRLDQSLPKLFETVNKKANDADVKELARRTHKLDKRVTKIWTIGATVSAIWTVGAAWWMKVKGVI